MNKKKQYLRIEEKKKKRIKFQPKGVFWQYLKEGKLPFSPIQFYLLSIISCGLFAIIYYSLSHFALFSIALALLGLILPYLTLGIPSILNAKVNEAIDYKEFIAILQSSLRASNSTSEAIRIVADSPDLNKHIKPIMEEIARELSMGESLPTALDKAKAKSNNNYFKMALTIVKINHSVGSDETITALKNIQKSMDATIDNVQLFKDKVNGIVATKSLFLAITLVIPFFLFTQMKEVTNMFFTMPAADLIMAVVMVFIILGQFVMDKAAYKLIKEV